MSDCLIVELILISFNFIIFLHIIKNSKTSIKQLVFFTILIFQKSYQPHIASSIRLFGLPCQQLFPCSSWHSRCGWNSARPYRERFYPADEVCWLQDFSWSFQCSNVTSALANLTRPTVFLENLRFSSKNFSGRKSNLRRKETKSFPHACGSIRLLHARRMDSMELYKEEKD